MAIAKFGSKSFSVSSKKIYTFSELSLSGTLEIDEQEVKNGKPKTIIKGPSLEELSFEIKLSASLGVDVIKEINDWRAIRDKGVPYPFIVGSKSISKNKFLLISVGYADTVIDGKGRFGEAKLSLSFKEYAGAGKATNNTGKSGKKRNNKNAKSSKSKKKKKTEKPKNVVNQILKW